MYLQNVQFYVCFTHENMKTKLSKVGYFSKIAEIFMYCPWRTNLAKDSKSTRFIWVFIVVLGIYNFGLSLDWIPHSAFPLFFSLAGIPDTHVWNCKEQTILILNEIESWLQSLEIYRKSFTSAFSCYWSKLFWICTNFFWPDQKLFFI